MVRPVIDEAQLGDLHELERIYLREEFKQQLESLQELLLSMAEGKLVGGMLLEGKAVRMYLEELLPGINSGTIDTCLTVSYERMRAYSREKCQE